MSKPKIKRKSRKPLSMRRYRILVDQHLRDTSLLDAFIYPPIQPEESARARYLADKMLGELAQADRDTVKALRVRAVTVIEAYRMITGGVVRQLDEMIRVGPVAAPTAEPTVMGPAEVTQELPAIVEAARLAPAVIEVLDHLIPTNDSEVSK